MMREFQPKRDVQMRPLRSILLAITLTGGVPLLLSSHAFAEDNAGTPASIVAVIDRARLVKIPAGTQTLVIGNPTVADVTMLHENNLVVLTPKAFGETNFIALDGQGNPLAESTIDVISGGDALVVQRGMDRESYSCLPRCQPTERLGDDGKYLATVAADNEQHHQRLSNSKAPTSGVQ